MSMPWSTLRAFSSIVDDSGIRSISDVNKIEDTHPRGVLDLRRERTHIYQ
jgi:hypothetical protein